MVDATNGADFSRVDVASITKKFKLQDRIFFLMTFASAALVVLMLLAILVVLVIDALPTFQTYGLSFLWGTVWSAPTEKFGAVPAVLGTLISSLIAMLIAVPISFGIAIFLTELCPARCAVPSVRPSNCSPAFLPSSTASSASSCSCR